MCEHVHLKSEDGWVCVDCGYKYPEDTKFNFNRHTYDGKWGNPFKSARYDEYREHDHDYLGYRGQLEDSYDQEAFDYEHEGYRESDM